MQTTDPLSFIALSSYNVLSQAYEGFTTLAPDGRIVPALATSWQTPDGGRTWRIALRQGVRFHSGREFTAEDVRWTFTHLLKRRQPASLGAFELLGVVGARAVQENRSADLAGVTVVDRYTIEVRFDQPDVLFPLTPFFFIDSAIEAEAGPDWANRVSAGTGPFRLVAWHRGQEVAFAAHHDYWGGAPSIAGIRFAIVPHAETLLTLFDSGNLDFAVLPESASRPVLDDPRYAARRQAFPRSQVRYLGLTQALYPPFRDPRVRKAVALALDPGAVISGLYHGAATAMNGTVPPGLGGTWADDLPPLPHDPVQAKQLLAEAGYPEGRGLPPLELVGTDTLRDEVTVYADQLGAVLGIPVGIRILERGSAIAAANAGRLAFFVSGWTADYPDPMSILQPVWYGSSPFNRSRWRNPEFDRLIDQAKTIPDPGRRRDLYHQAEHILMADWAMVPLPVPMVVALVRPGVTGVHVLPMGNIDVRGAVVP